MATTDTQLQQLVINVGTEAQIANAIAGGTITNDMLSITTDGADISYDWIGTLAEYEAQQVATNHPDWLCFITDDVTISNENVYENVYTKAETNELFMAKNDLIAYQPNLLDFKWADHLLNDIQWLRADTFSWQDGSVYEAVYNHLYTEFIAAITAQGNVPYTETIGGVTISYYLAEDGHKICPASEESDLSSLFETVGVAWYYLLDTANQRFKLPRTKFGFQGRHTTQTAVGSYIAPGLPNITGTISPQVSTFTSKSASGAFVESDNSAIHDGSYLGSELKQYGYDFNASRCSSVYGASTTVQAPATEMYLYFYVGTFTQSAIVNTAGVSTEILNDLNEHKVIAFQAPTSENNYMWYRKYADGWVEQGCAAVKTGGNGVQVTFPVPLNTSNGYNVTLTMVNSDTSDVPYILCYYDQQSTGIKVTSRYANSVVARDFKWMVCGMAA